jgi:hypothetical protein
MSSGFIDNRQLLTRTANSVGLDNCGHLLLPGEMMPYALAPIKSIPIGKWTEGTYMRISYIL